MHRSVPSIASMAMCALPLMIHRVTGTCAEVPPLLGCVHDGDEATILYYGANANAKSPASTRDW